MTKRKTEGPDRANRRELTCFPCEVCREPKVMTKADFDYKIRETGYRPSTCGTKCAAEKRRKTRTRELPNVKEPGYESILARAERVA